MKAHESTWKHHLLYTYVTLPSKMNDVTHSLGVNPNHICCDIISLASLEQCLQILSLPCGSACVVCLFNWGFQKQIMMCKGLCNQVGPSALLSPWCCTLMLFPILISQVAMWDEKRPASAGAVHRRKSSFSLTGPLSPAKQQSEFPLRYSKHTDLPNLWSLSDVSAWYSIFIASMNTIMACTCSCSIKKFFPCCTTGHLW